MQNLSNSCETCLQGATNRHGLQNVDQNARWYTRRRGAQTFEIGIAQCSRGVPDFRILTLYRQYCSISSPSSIFDFQSSIFNQPSSRQGLLLVGSSPHQQSNLLFGIGRVRRHISAIYLRMAWSAIEPPLWTLIGTPASEPTPMTPPTVPRRATRPFFYELTTFSPFRSIPFQDNHWYTSSESFKVSRVSPGSAEFHSTHRAAFALKGR